jgi:hypothetical protein
MLPNSHATKHLLEQARSGDRNARSEIFAQHRKPGIREGAAAKRYVRNLTRLPQALADLPGGWEGL